MNTLFQNLTEDLQHPDKNVRGKAAVNLGKLDDVSTLPILLQALITETDMYVREDITWALVRMGDMALQPLLELVHDPDPAIRHYAVHVLGKMKDIRSLDTLIGALQDTDALVVSKAAFGLAQIGDDRAVPALIAIVGHPAREVETMLMSVLERFGTIAVQGLIALMTDENWRVREQATDILGQLGDEQAIPLLIAALGDDVWQIRFAAVTGLSYLGGAEAKAALKKMPKDAEPHVNDLVARVLKKMRR